MVLNLSVSFFNSCTHTPDHTIKLYSLSLLPINHRSASISSHLSAALILPMAKSKTTQYHYPSSCSTFSTPQRTQDVFLSFRHDEDAAKNFAHRLYKALRQAGIHTFIRDDDDELPEEKAIQESTVSIVVFSKYYADCTRCLDELEKIMDYRRTIGHKLVLPVFYDVDPSHVRRQTGSFGEALDRHEQEVFVAKTGKSEKWRAALTEVANLSGWDLRNVPQG